MLISRWVLNSGLFFPVVTSSNLVRGTTLCVFFFFLYSSPSTFNLIPHHNTQTRHNINSFAYPYSSGNTNTEFKAWLIQVTYILAVQHSTHLTEVDTRSRPPPAQKIHIIRPKGTLYRYLLHTPYTQYAHTVLGKNTGRLMNHH